MRRTLRDISDPFLIPEKEFIGLYRLSKLLVQNLIEELEPHLPPRERTTAIPNYIKVRKT